MQAIASITSIVLGLAKTRRITNYCRKWSLNSTSRRRQVSKHHQYTTRHDTIASERKHSSELERTSPSNKIDLSSSTEFDLRFTKYCSTQHRESSFDVKQVVYYGTRQNQYFLEGSVPVTWSEQVRLSWRLPSSD